MKDEDNFYQPASWLKKGKPFELPKYDLPKLKKELTPQQYNNVLKTIEHFELNSVIDVRMLPHVLALYKSMLKDELDQEKDKGKITSW